MKNSVLKISCFALCTLYSLFASAQKEYNIWYFGSNAGLDFNSGSPVALTNSAMSTYEGCSSICDTAGNLLFYTDGSTVWNRNHAVMANGTGLTGNSTATQSGLIVKQPGNANLYYIFTTFTTLNYSVVDMTLNGGLGDVTATKNVFMSTGSEKLCATRHANGTDIWVMGRVMYTNDFVAFLLTSSGVSGTAVQSYVGIMDSCGPGQMKFSPIGNKIVVARCFVSPTMYLADFDNSTGVVSGGFAIPTPYPQTYGTEFSPDGTKLYGGANVGLYYVVQFDLNAGSPAAIIASATTIGSTVSYEPGSLQLGPDKKIYISTDGSTYLDAINNPNVLGLGCNFTHNAVSLNGRTAQLGLPSSNSSTYSSACALQASFTSSDTAFCDEAGKCIDFFDHSLCNPTSWHWIFNGATPDTSDLQNPTNICYYNTGTYAVTLIVTNSTGSDTLNVSPHIIFAVPPTPPIVTVTGGDTLISTHCFGYQWYRDGSLIAGATDSFYVATQGGTYSVQGADSLGCTGISNGILITGLSDLTSGETGIKLYPNPVSDELTISFNRKETCVAVITDMLGQELIRNMIYEPQNTRSISIKELSNGIYLLQLRTGTQTINRKFVVLHK